LPAELTQLIATGGTSPEMSEDRGSRMMQGPLASRRWPLSTQDLRVTQRLRATNAGATVFAMDTEARFLPWQLKCEVPLHDRYAIGLAPCHASTAFG
jgi:hypothetical protein